jgi:FMN phosphatase YigB (HAD superfamily)
MMTGVSAVGFDLDQTLYQDNAETLQAKERELGVLLQQYGVESVEVFRERQRQLGSGSKALSSFGVPEPRERLRDVLDKSEVHRFLKTDPELVRMLKNLATKFQLFLVTDARRENALKKLAALGVGSELFSVVICWDYPLKPGQIVKEDGSALSYAAKVLEVSGEEVLFVGNSLQDDIEPAQRLGFLTYKVSAEHPIYALEKRLLS